VNNSIAAGKVTAESIDIEHEEGLGAVHTAGHEQPKQDSC
jgi:hypothetical protein